MAVYVDSAFIPYRRMLMCHMIADTEEELHRMADMIGVARRHYQSHTKYPHYDICKQKRQLAIQAGAIEVSSKELIRISRLLVG